jgi:hypothetical protein
MPVRPEGEDPTRTRDTRVLDEPAVFLQSDWACAWIRVEGPVAEDCIPVVLRAVRAACAERPRKLRLLLNRARLGQEVQDCLLAEVAGLVREYGIKLVTPGGSQRRPTNGRRLPAGAAGGPPQWLKNLRGVGSPSWWPTRVSNRPS